MSTSQEELRAKREQMLRKLEQAGEARGTAANASSSPASPEVAEGLSSQAASTSISPQLEEPPVECTTAAASQEDKLCDTVAEVPRRSSSPVLNGSSNGESAEVAPDVNGPTVNGMQVAPYVNGSSVSGTQAAPYVNGPSGSGMSPAGATYVTINVLNTGDTLSTMLSSFLNQFQPNGAASKLLLPSATSSNNNVKDLAKPMVQELCDTVAKVPRRSSSPVLNGALNGESAQVSTADTEAKFEEPIECPSPQPEAPNGDIVDLTTPPQSPDFSFMRDDTDEEDQDQDPDDPDFLPAGVPSAILPPRDPQPRNASRLSLGGKRNCHGVLQASLERFRSDGAGPSRERQPTVENPLPVQQVDGLAEARNAISAGLARMAGEVQARAPRQPLAQAMAFPQACHPLQAEAAALPQPPQPAQAAALPQPAQQAQAPAPVQAVAEAEPAEAIQGTVCSVCLVNPLSGILRCNHLFCVDCLNQLKALRRPCPICRKAFRKWKRVYV